MVYIGIVVPEKFVTSDRYFSNVTSQINEYFEDPDTHFILGDQCPVIAKYLNGHQYRKCTIYHLGVTPKHKIGKYTNKGGFSSYFEINAAIKEDADLVIDVT